ncbi:hypothetical protein M6G53_24375 [Serratia nevei]|uniref:hypothetical protein n=1 Tax=Serratia nevei TaxID=2703794 RepID=UPI00209CCC52|nr:hypothetical protein [Serratia nevei]MCP1108506.1 hypothetical protein [Serratia nevei]
MSVHCILPFVIVAILGSISAKSAAGDNVAVTVETYTLRYPYASPIDNQAALAGMLQGAKVTGHYWKQSRVLKLTRCMTGVTCYPSPHFADDIVDRTVTVRPQIIAGASERQPTRLVFNVPASHRDALLDGVTLVLPLKPVWQQPSVQQALQRAEVVLPEYAKTRRAFEMGASVSVNLALPKTVGEFGPMLNYCAEIPNPLSWSHSGVISMRILVRQASNPNTPWPYIESPLTSANLGTEESCATWRPEVENSYLWRNE